MTTAYTSSQPARLPSNHTAHVEAILAREAKWRAERKKNRRSRAIVASCFIAAFIVTAFLLLK